MPDPAITKCLGWLLGFIFAAWVIEPDFNPDVGKIWKAHGGGHLPVQPSKAKAIQHVTWIRSASNQHRLIGTLDRILSDAANDLCLSPFVLRLRERPPHIAASHSIAAATRAASSTSSAAGDATATRLNVAAAASTTLALGSMAWYYHLYGPVAFAMTPAEEGLHATKYPWVHNKWFKTFDHQALRRGFQVYQEVCQSCHSLSRVPYRTLVGSVLTVDEAKALAEENEYPGEPDEQGEIQMRPGKLADYMLPPYKNEEAARFANNGALPPDLSLIIKARHGGCDYIFSLLTGYPEEPPAGVQVAPGMNFNPYFPGTGIAMARVLYEGLVDYEDGTPATTSQMAKDVVEFLNWAAEPEMDDRKRMGMKVLVVSASMWAVSVWVKRYKWAWLKSRKIAYDPPKEVKTRR
ncbi:hypothetical protein FAVG1_02015 [Fusarium avenaceum]|nr:hypothetical protein FAVG1_02015 [Fusarium avenaceum]